MFFPVKYPLPVITARVNFKFNKFHPPPPITLRQSHERKVRLIHRSRTPYTCPRGLSSYGRHHCQTTPFNGADEDEESDAIDELNLIDWPESEEEHTLSVAKVPKPPGEAGRKNSGGFNLQEVLGWNDDKYKNFMVSYASLLTTSTHQSKKQWIADETTSKLSLSKPFSKQKPEAIQDLIKQVSRDSRVTVKEFVIYINTRGLRSLKLLVDMK